MLTLPLGIDPMLFPKPDEYNPYRWIDNESPNSLIEEKMIFLGYGTCECLGRKFACIEAVAFLTTFLNDWKIEAIFLPGENTEQWRERVLQPVIGIGIAFDSKTIPLRLVKRAR